MHVDSWNHHKRPSPSSETGIRSGGEPPSYKGRGAISTARTQEQPNDLTNPRCVHTGGDRCSSERSEIPRRSVEVVESLPSAAGAALAAGAAPAVASAARHPHTRFRGWNTSRERFLLGNQSHNRARMRCDPPCTGGEAAFIGGAGRPPGRPRGAARDVGPPASGRGSGARGSYAPAPGG